MICLYPLQRATVLREIITKFNIATDNQPEGENIVQGQTKDARMKLLQKHSRRSQNGIEFELTRFANIEAQEPNVLTFWRGKSEILRRWQRSQKFYLVNLQRVQHRKVPFLWLAHSYPVDGQRLTLREPGKYCSPMTTTISYTNI